MTEDDQPTPHPPAGPSTGSPEAEFTEFVHATWAALYRTAYLLLGDAHLAEDLVQTALARTYASWRRMRDPSRARAYARTVLVNTATSWFRKKSWRREVATESLPGPPAPGATAEPDPTTRSVVLAALRSLPPRQRAAVVLRFYEDLSVAQTARALGCSEGTVKSQTSDALAHLRILLGDEIAPIRQGITHD